MTYCEFCGRQLENGERCRCRSAVKPDAAAEINGIFASAAQTDPFFHAPQDVPVRRERQQEIPSAAFEPEQIPQPVQPVIPEEPPEQTAAVKSKKKSGILLTAAAFLLALTGFLVWFFALRDTVPDYEKPIKSMFDSINQRDYKAGKDALLTTHYFEWWTDYKFDGDNAECRSYYKELCADYSERMVEYFDEAADELDTKSSKIQYSYSVVSKEKLDRDELENLEDRFYKFYDTGDLKEGYRLKLKVTFTAGKESKTSRGYISVVNVRKDGWKLVPESADDFDFGEYDADDMIDVILDA